MVRVHLEARRGVAARHLLFCFSYCVGYLGIQSVAELVKSEVLCVPFLAQFVCQPRLRVGEAAPAPSRLRAAMHAGASPMFPAYLKARPHVLRMPRFVSSE